MNNNAIVVGYEATEQGRDAIELGAVLARITGGPMVVLTVGAEEGAERLASFVSAHLAELELAVRARSLETGSPVTELQRLAVAERAWAIVVGSTHRSGIGRVLPGSVGERLLRGAPCAIAVAPRGFTAGRAERRAQRRADLSLSDEESGPRVIGVGFDGGAESKEALAVAATLAQRAGATVRVIAVAPSGQARPKSSRGRSVRSPTCRIDFTTLSPRFRKSCGPRRSIAGVTPPRSCSA